MNFRQLEQMFHRQIHPQDIIEDIALAEYIDDAQQQIAKFYGPVETISFTIPNPDPAITHRRKTMPDDFIKVLDVYRNGEESFLYQVYGNTIQFEDEGNYVVRYHRVPVKLDKTDLGNAELDIDILFHESIVKWMLYRYWSTESDGVSNEVGFAVNYRTAFMEEISASVQVLMERKVQFATDVKQLTEIAGEHVTWREVKNLTATEGRSLSAGDALSAAELLGEHDNWRSLMKIFLSAAKSEAANRAISSGELLDKAEHWKNILITGMSDVAPEMASAIMANEIDWQTAFGHAIVDGISLPAPLWLKREEHKETEEGFTQKIALGGGWWH